jgi:hypothetical protein
MTPDIINGAFESLAGLMVLNHCRVLRHDRAVRGVSIASVAFFTAWGVWNPHYYPALNQPASFLGGLVVVAANTIYVAMLAHYAGTWRALRRRLGALVCRVRGHILPAVLDYNISRLDLCPRCGADIYGRTWADLQSMSDEALEDLQRRLDLEEQA